MKTKELEIKPFPRYVKLHTNSTDHICAIEHQGGGLYYRVAGHWELQVKWIDGKLICVDGKQYNMGHCDGWEVLECTRAEWENDNQGYV